jgi:hypothetical protein
MFFNIREPSLPVVPVKTIRGAFAALVADSIAMIYVIVYL